MNVTLRSSRTVWAILAAGLTAAVVEMIFVLSIQYKLGAAPCVVLQSIASGILGKVSYERGFAAASLGAALHVLISIVAAGVFVLAARIWDDVLLRKPIVSGMIYGVVVYAVMTYVVIPLSTIGFAPPKSLFRIWMSLAVHVFAFGLPLAVVSSSILRARNSSAGKVRKSG